MCGRFNVLNTPGLGVLLASLGCEITGLKASINVAPTQTVSLLRRDGKDAPALYDAYWWLTPSWAKERSQKYAMFNARCEGLSKSSAFRKPFARQRGIVPMSSFIEWRGRAGYKQPWLITSPEESLAVAALWDIWAGGSEPLLSCTLVTTQAAASFEPWHHRMPVLLKGDEGERWLDNETPVEATDSLFEPVLKHSLRLVPLDSSVGNSRNTAESVLAPIGDWVELSAERP